MNQFIITGYILWATGSYSRDNCTVAAIKGSVFGIVFWRSLNIALRVGLLIHMYHTFA